MGFLSVDLREVDLTRGGRRVLEAIHWRIRPRQRWALLGHNGAGKTQLLKLLSGDVWPTPTARGRRTWRWNGETHHEPLELKELIAYVGAERQDQYTRHGWNHTVREVVTTGLFGTQIPLQAPSIAQKRRVAAAIERLGLPNLAARRMLTLSYGEQRLALVARALVSRPRLLLLDEVFNGLDRARSGALMKFLETSRTPLPWVLAVHRAEHVPRSVTHLLVLERGRVRYRGPRTERALQGFFEQARDESVLQTRVKRAGVRSRIRHRKGAVVLSIAGADVYVEEKRILAGLDWTLRAGEHWAIVGRNGSGKSTLVRLLYGDISPALGGRVERAGFAQGTHIEDFKKTVGLLSPQLQTDHAGEDLTVEDIVVSGRYASIGLNEPSSPADRRAARRWIEALDLGEFAAQRARELSYGQMRRVLLARAMVNEPRLLLLDEPCTGLDASTRAVLLDHLEHLARQGVQIVMATHHEADLIPSIGHVLRLRAGSAAAQVRRHR